MLETSTSANLRFTMILMISVNLIPIYFFKLTQKIIYKQIKYFLKTIQI